ncbi:MAG: hypothetical protein ACNY01_08745 [Desulfobacteria bacterium]
MQQVKTRSYRFVKCSLEFRGASLLIAHGNLGFSGPTLCSSLSNREKINYFNQIVLDCGARCAGEQLADLVEEFFCFLADFVVAQDLFREFWYQRKSCFQSASGSGQERKTTLR